jgi:hypothetical protein
MVRVTPAPRLCGVRRILLVGLVLIALAVPLAWWGANRASHRSSPGARCGSRVWPGAALVHVTLRAQ